MYDHISFHTEEQPSLSDVQAALHMGYYYAWAVSQNLHSAAAEALPLFGALRHGEISGAECKPKPNFIGRHGSLHIKNN